MFPHKPISVLSILTVILVLLLCSPWSAMAQFSEQRLIPIAATDPDHPAGVTENDDAPPFDNPIQDAIPQPFPAHDFVVYGRAPKGYPINAADAPDAYISDGSAEGRYLTPRPLRAYPELTVRRTEFNADARLRDLLRFRRNP